MLMMIRDGSRYQIGWIFGTIPNGLRPLPTFSENYIAFVFGKRPKKTFVKVQNLQHNFWNFSQKFIRFGSVTRPLAGCQIYICPWQPVQNMISLVTWPRPSLGKTRIAFYFSYNFSPLSTNIFWSKYFQWAGNFGRGVGEPQSSFEALFPKVFRCPLKVDLVSIVRHPAPPKVSWSDSCSPKMAIFRSCF